MILLCMDQFARRRSKAMYALLQCVGGRRRQALRKKVFGGIISWAWHSFRAALMSRATSCAMQMSCELEIRLVGIGRQLVAALYWSRCCCASIQAHSTLQFCAVHAHFSCVWEPCASWFHLSWVPAFCTVKFQIVWTFMLAEQHQCPGIR